MSTAPPRHYLVMTATITPPPDAPGLTRTDPQLRHGDYQIALTHYCALLGDCLDGIVFAENSGSDLTDLRRLAAESTAGPVEFLALDASSNEPAGGRCFGESRILDAVMARSALVAHAMAADVFWKVTGRYRVLNLPSLIHTRPKDFDFYCDLRNAPSPWADMRIMGWTRAGFAHCLEGVGDLIREDANRGRPGEETLYGILRKRAVRSRVITCLRREPLIDGIRAYDNRNWSEGRQKVVYWLRHLQRLVLRRVWF